MEKQEYKYMVGVRCMTFNQSKYITDALNGFVMQQTNFPFVVMVVDDASTDGEQDVIRAYMNDQFDLNDTNIAYETETDYAYISYAQHKLNRNCFFAVLYLKENHYSQRKAKAPYLAEWQDKVKYIALCEGDDYWIYPNKLQIQVDFLEKNEEYSMCFHNAIITYEDAPKSSIIFNNIQIDKDISLRDLISRWIVPTASIFMRSSVFPIPPLPKNVISADMWFTLCMRDVGKIWYTKKVMSCYRVTYGTDSITSRMKNRGAEMCYQRYVLYKSYDEITGYKYHELLNNYIRYWYKYSRFYKLKNKNILLAVALMPCFFIKKIYWKFFKNLPYS